MSLYSCPCQNLAIDMDYSFKNEDDMDKLELPLLRKGISELIPEVAQDSLEEDIEEYMLEHCATSKTTVEEKVFHHLFSHNVKKL
jgi:hypothetical protein